MCGIIGILSASSLYKGAKTRTVAFDRDLPGFLSDGAVASSVRGMDSTGIMQVDASGKMYIYKEAVPASTFITMKDAIPFFRDLDRSPITVLHVRAATAGAVTAENAHPFEIMDEDNENRWGAGVHNGTLNNWKSFKEAKNFQVDSEFAIHAIINEGRDAFTKKISGAYSFVWWDSDHPYRAYFARNASRPMWMVRTKNKKHILFGSEPKMLIWLAERNNITIEETAYSLDTNQIYFVDTDKDELQLGLQGDRYTEPAAYSAHTYSFGKQNNRRRGVHAFDDWLFEGGSNGAESFFLKFDKLFEEPKKKDMEVPLGAIVWPKDAFEIAEASKTHYDPESASTKEIAEADSNGLLGQLVVFTSDGLHTDFAAGAMSYGTIETVVLNKGADNAGTPSNWKALLVNRKSNYNTLMQEGDKSVAVIAGMRDRYDVVSKDMQKVVLLSNLTTAGAASHAGAIRKYVGDASYDKMMLDWEQYAT